MLEDAARADRAGADHVAWDELRVLRGPVEDRLPGVVHVAEVASRALFAVDAGNHLEAQVAELVRRHDHRAERGCKVLPFRGTEADLHLLPLEIARRPIVYDREPPNRALGTHHGRDLELVVALIRPGREGNLVVGSVDRGWVREVEDRQLIPLVRHHWTAEDPSRVANVVLEGVEVAHRGRTRHWR